MIPAHAWNRLLRKRLPLTALSDIYRLIRTGRVRINGNKTKQNYRTIENDVLDIDVDRAELPEKNTNETESIKNLAYTDFFKRNLKIIFEDKGLIACNKPPNLVVTPAPAIARATRSSTW